VSGGMWKLPGSQPGSQPAFTAIVLMKLSGAISLCISRFGSKPCRKNENIAAVRDYVNSSNVPYAK
jgi:hypothetical protein